MMKDLKIREMQKSKRSIMIFPYGESDVQNEIYKFYKGMLSIINIVYPIRHIQEEDDDDYYAGDGYNF